MYKLCRDLHETDSFDDPSDRKEVRLLGVDPKRPLHWREGPRRWWRATTSQSSGGKEVSAY